MTRTTARTAAVWMGIAAGTGAIGCADAEQEVPLGRAQQAIESPLASAVCEAQVTGAGMVAIETEYLPNVLMCEHGGAPLETLKAQAIAARSVLYWTVLTHGEICDSQGCQVFSCGKEPLPIHQQAVDETSGLYLSYNGNLTYGAYVAGDASTQGPDCIGAPGEGPITYNEGLTGTDVEQTTLLFVHDPSDASYGQNRGCMSQNGSKCLEQQAGYDYLQILRFYYGADVELLQASGECILEVEPPEEPTGAGGQGGSSSSGTTGGGTSSGGAGNTAGGSSDDDPSGGAAAPADGAEADDAPSSDLHGVVCRTGAVGASGKDRASHAGWLALIALVGWMRGRRRKTR